MTQSPDMERESLNLHLKTALSTQSGQVLHEWLAVQCCMRGITANQAGESVISLAKKDALRELFINLETRIKENAHVRIEHSNGP